MADGTADALEQAVEEKERIYQRLKEAQTQEKETVDPSDRIRQGQRVKILRDMYREACERVDRLRPTAERRQTAPKHREVSVSWDFMERSKTVWSDLGGYSWDRIGRLQEEATAQGAQLLMLLLQRGQCLLTERQRYYIGKCFGEKKTISQVAEEAGVRRSSVSRVVKAGLRRMEASVLSSLYAMECVEGDTFDHRRWAAATEALTERQRECLYYLLTENVSLSMIAAELGRNKSTLSRTNERISTRIACAHPSIPGKRPAQTVKRSDWRGKPETEIAEQLGISHGAYYLHICRGKPVGNIPRLSYECLIRRERGMTPSEIAEELQISAGTVRKHLEKYKDADLTSLPAPAPYHPAKIQRRKDLDVRRLLSSAASKTSYPGTIGSMISSEIYQKMLAVSGAK